MKYQISEESHEKIEKLIASDESVVGIDAKETHIIIIHMLMEIQERLDKIEEQMDAQS